MLAEGLQNLLGVGPQAGDEEAAFGFDLSLSGTSLRLRLGDKSLCNASLIVGKVLWFMLYNNRNSLACVPTLLATVFDVYF